MLVEPGGDVNGRIRGRIWRGSGDDFIWHDYFECFCQCFDCLAPWFFVTFLEQRICEKRGGGQGMREMIREYGRVILSAVTGMVLVGILVYACRCISLYMAYFDDCLMGVR